MSTPEGAALRIRFLIRHAEERNRMGSKARDFVRENFLLTRQLREYLTLMVGLIHGGTDRTDAMNGDSLHATTTLRASRTSSRSSATHA